MLKPPDRVISPSNSSIKNLFGGAKVAQVSKHMCQWEYSLVPVEVWSGHETSGSQTIYSSFPRWCLPTYFGCGLWNTEGDDVPVHSHGMLNMTCHIQHATFSDPTKVLPSTTMYVTYGLHLEQK